MNGLIRKDIYLLKEMRFVLLLMAAIEIFLVFQNKAVDFAMGYMTVLGAMFVINTISYDEPGFGFLMTLPVSRKQYVAAKYLLGICSGVLFELMSIGIVTAAGLILPDMRQGWFRLLSQAGMYCGLVILLQSLMIPLLLKFGAEKGRNIILLGVVAIFLTSVELVRFLMPAEEGLPRISEWIAVHSGMTAGIGICFVCLFLAGSIWLSSRIMARKEF